MDVLLVPLGANILVDKRLRICLCVISGSVEVDPSGAASGIDWWEAAVEKRFPCRDERFGDFFPLGPLIDHGGCGAQCGEVDDWVGCVLYCGCEVEFLDFHVEDADEVCDEVLENCFGGCAV